MSANLGTAPYGVFVSVNVFHGIYSTQQSEQELLLELRKLPDGKMILFTMLEGQQVHANSIQDFVLSHPSCMSLSIRHAIHILWNDVLKSADIVEVYAPTNHPLYRVSVELQVRFEDIMHTSGMCDDLYEARRELDEAVGPAVLLWLKRCCDCVYSWPATLGPGWDPRDDLRCYRDAPVNLFQEVRQQGNGARREALFAGNYFVHAFHTCAAWHPQSDSVSMTTKELNIR